MASLSGPNSRRRLGTESGNMRREARRLNHEGNDRAAGAVGLAAAQQRLTEGSSIGVAKEREAFDSKQQALDNGLMESRRRGLLRPEATDDTTQAATGDLLSQRQSLFKQIQSGGVTDASRQQARTLGVSDSSFNRATAGLAAPAPLAAASSSAAPLGNTPTAQPVGPPTSSGVPILSGVLSNAPVRRLGGLIDGKPAASVLAGMRGGQGEEPGNLQQALAAAKTARPVDLPGNAAGPPRSAAVGPLTQAMNEALARNAERASDSAAAGAITAGLNSSPTPTLGTQGLGRRTLGATLPVAAQVPPLTPDATLPAASRLSRPSGHFLNNTPVDSVEDRLKRNKDAALKDPRNRPTPAWLQGTGAGGLLERLSR